LAAEENELREALDRMEKTGEINKKMAEEGVSWTFSPPLAPHFGGAWERLVRSAKTALRVVLRSQTVSEEVLTTLLVEVEAMMNARPLTHLSVNPRDNSPITPNHFLLLRAHPHVPPDVIEYSGSLSRRRYLAAQELAKSFWRRWLLETRRGQPRLPGRQADDCQPAWRKSVTAFLNRFRKGNKRTVNQLI
jgi:hypothetical protein